jgi:hypothetical protein
MKTGVPLEDVPDLRKEIHSPFDWTDRQRVKPLYGRRTGKGDADYFAGLSVAGRVLQVELGLDEVYYLSMAKADHAFAGFRLRRSGASDMELSPLWLIPFMAADRFEKIATGVSNFAMPGQGNVIYVTGGHGRKKESSEAFFYHRGDRSAWNILEGIERLPELDREFAAKDYVQDKLTVTLVEGFGSRNKDQLMLCLCRQNRADMRAELLLNQEKRLLPVDWRRALVITADGRRALAPLPHERRTPDHTWLHNSGRLLTGEYVWQDVDPGRRRQVRLTERTIQRPGK